MTDNLDTLAVPEISKSLPLCRQSTFPSSLALLGPAAHFAWDEFFIGGIRNRHTRTVYGRSVRNFLKWAEREGVAVEKITPGMVGSYLDQLSASPPTKKLILAALRGFFDALVLRHVLILNPAASVRAERYEVVEGKTPEITPVQARALLDSIDTATSVGLRDKAVIATLIYTAARAGAVGKLRRKDLSFDGSQYVLAFGEKGGMHRSIPVRHDLELLLTKDL